MKRKPGATTPLEALVLEAAALLKREGHAEFFGFLLAKELKRLRGARYRTAFGTLYKALDRMERAGWLKSRWEEARLAEEQGRPRRRFYLVTAQGEAALHAARAAAPGLSLAPEQA